MKKAVKYFAAFLFVITIFMGQEVYAKEVYYTNSKGVSFTKEQYDFYTYLTHDGFQEHVTQDMLDEIAGADLSKIQVKKVGICPNPQRRDDNMYVITSAKSLEMSNYCYGGYCSIYSEVEWFGDPTVKSYDLYGTYFDSTISRIGPPLIFATSTDYQNDEETIVYENDGFGAVVQVPTTGEDIIIDMIYNYSGSGTVFVSYQHAMSPITLANAQLFNIDLIGYGGVFDFYGAAVGVYDQMPGVHMDV